MTTASQTPEETTNTPDVIEGLQYRRAYEQTAADRAALKEEELPTVNADVPSVVHIAIGALRHIADLRPKMTELPVNLALLDKVEVYAHAVGYAHALYAVAAAPPAELEALYEACLLARTTLRSDANNLALHGIVNADSLDGLNGEIGHRNVGYDLLSLVAIYRSVGNARVGRSAILPESLDRSEQMASSLLDMVAKRETQLKDQTDVVNQRRRAFALLLKAYDEAQQAVSFVRWKQGDAEKFTPSLFSVKGAGRPKPSRPATPAQTSALVAPSDTASSSLTYAAPAPSSTPVNPAPTTPGARGGNPFA